MSGITGKIRFHIDTWKLYTNDPWILQTVAGYHIEFDSCPIQFSVPKEISFSESQKDLVSKEIQCLLEKGAIVPSCDEIDQFISNIFIVPKPNGKFRPVINLRELNYFVTYKHFKQETFPVVLDMIQQYDFFTKLDLSDAYFSIGIDPFFQKFLKFHWQGQLFKFLCLPFGLSSAPRVYTKVLKPIYKWFRQQGFRCSYYIDDSLNMSKVETVCRKNVIIMADTLKSLGFTVNKEKSIFLPTQRIVFFGFILDSVLFKVFLPEEKVEKIINLAKKLLEKPVVVIRNLASLIGLLVHAFYAVLEAPLHYRALERDKVRGLDSSYDFDRSVNLSADSVSELKWWIVNVKLKNGKAIRPPKPTIFLQTDASCLGWGAFDKGSGKSVGGRWSEAESRHHINFLELLAIFFALQVFCSECKSVHISIQSDNTCAIAYLNDMGGMASNDMDLLSKEIWNWCLERDIFISASFIQGACNFFADFSSRNFSDTTEWQLKRDIFLRLSNQCFIPDIDLFASRLNYQVQRFVTWFPQPGAYKVDAFSFCWTGYLPYIFAPFNVIGKVLNKIVEDKVYKALLVVPNWPSQTWFPLLLSLLSHFPVRLPRHRDLLTLPHNGQFHPMGTSLCLVGVVVSGDTSRTEIFQKELSKQSVLHGVRERRNNTVQHGKAGVFGVFHGKEIHFKQLK
ncbi:MAG: reverse transcriptase domain-containing protein [Candidatus Thiodiazotropha endolucinida]|nr:hypothetical protein [Candidatus Thiodiazotropha taylori]MCW4264162.1 reverse transcriptase domain-containing protein [Candidatus Thiodiazotropha endolucinida]